MGVTCKHVWWGFKILIYFRRFRICIFLSCFRTTIWHFVLSPSILLSMKKNKKWLLLIIPPFLTTITIGFCISLMFYNPFLSSRMVEYYSNDDNFYRYEASIRKVYNNGYLDIESIKKIQEDGEKNNIDKINYIQARVFSNNINETMKIFNPKIGDTFYFTGSLKVFFDGCPVAIVQIEINDIEILSFSEGKAALLEWAAQIH